LDEFERYQMTGPLTAPPVKRVPIIKRIPAVVAGVVLLILAQSSGLAHPASGIVVTDQGDVLFIYGGHGVCKISPEGRLSYVHRAKDGHWMCLDAGGSFSHSQPKYFKRISPDGATPTIIFAGGGSPIAVLPDGFLYYVSGPEELTPAGLRLARNSPRGKVSVFAPALRRVMQDRGITGLTTGADGNLYVACPNAVFKVKSDGTFSTLADPIHLEGCDVDYPDNNTNNLLPFLRGLAADKQGTVFAAATGCHCVVKITAAGKVEVVLKSSRPWSPTGIAEHDGDIYVLEYTHATEPAATGWLPRVRKIARDGTVSTLVTVSAETQISGPE
jgi:hypothetical protein